MSNNVKPQIFRNIFNQVLEENVTCGSCGMGAEGTTQFSGDDKYAPGDTRVPFAIGNTKKKKPKIQKRPLVRM